MQSQRTTPAAGRTHIAWVCPTCQQQLGVYDGEHVTVWAAAPLILLPKIAVDCPRCRASAVWDFDNPPAPQQIDALGDLSLDDIIAAMESRWDSFRSTKLRERGTVAVGLRFDVFVRDGFRCRYCGISVDDGAILHADHVIPESKGGPTTLENLVTACIDCNLGKSDKELPT